MPSKREIAADILRLPPVSALVNLVSPGQRLMVLNYHRVVDSTRYDDHVISTNTAGFARQAKWLAANSAVVSGESVLEFVESRGKQPSRQVCLTFDDGYIDNYEAGVLLMETFRIPAIFFICTGFIETGRLPDWDIIAHALKVVTAKHVSISAVDRFGPWELDLTDYNSSFRKISSQYRDMTQDQQRQLIENVRSATNCCDAAPGDADPLFMTWEQIRDLAKMGHTIGAHTHTHPNVGSLTREEIDREVEQSTALIEENVGIRPTFFAYPFGKPGNHSADSRESLRAHGYRAAFTYSGGTNRYGATDPFEICRTSVEPNVTDAMLQARALTGLPI